MGVYELELAEVMVVYDTEDKLPLDPSGNLIIHYGVPSKQEIMFRIKENQLMN